MTLRQEVGEEGETTQLVRRERGAGMQAGKMELSQTVATKAGYHQTSGTNDTGVKLESLF